jgi:uncharacterized protein (DUF1015 family)
MAEILPFRALVYNPEVAGELARVVTQPYDKITPQMQARYYEASPYNLVRIILGRKEPGDSAENNVYRRAARDFHDWIGKRALIADREPALYVYNQEYALAGASTPTKTRRGLIALCRLENYGAGIVHRHEETLSGPKADRLELLKATRAHFGQIFMLYSDPEGAIERALASSTLRPADRLLKDEYGTAHSLWRVSEAEKVERVAEAMREKKLVIADGHHRYETALAYRDFRRAQGEQDARAEFVMVTLVRLESDGLTILPTHRMVHGLVDFDWSRFANQATAFFDREEIPASNDLRALLEKLRQAGQERPSFMAFGGAGRALLLKLREDLALERALPEVPEGLRRLDVVLLHRLVLEKILGIDAQAVREGKNLQYMREAEAAMRLVTSGEAQAAFLINPTPASAVWSNALAGRPLPQKSTDFYPKMLSGLTIFWLDNPAGI